MCIPRFSEAIVPVQIPQSFKGKEAILEPLANNLCPVMIGGSLMGIKNATGQMRVLNYRPHTVTLKKKCKIGKILYHSNVASITQTQCV